MIQEYQKKPIRIKAIKWNGNNYEEIFKFCNPWCSFDSGTLIIKTLEGNLKASLGDFIIKGINSEFYPCTPDIFDKTYELI